MERIGIHCRVFNPFMPGLNLFLNNRDQRKITVIDGKVGFTGGYNLANEYFTYTHPYGQWKDTGIRLEGDAVQSLTVTFLDVVAIVAGKDEKCVDKALKLIKVEYEVLEAVLDYHTCLLYTSNLVMDTTKLERCGIRFDTTQQGIQRCLKDYGLRTL